MPDARNPWENIALRDATPSVSSVFFQFVVFSFVADGLVE
jgi:hypothetical protein